MRFTFIEAIIIHVSIHIDVFSCSEWQLHFWVVVGAIIRVIAGGKKGHHRDTIITYSTVDFSVPMTVLFCDE